MLEENGWFRSCRFFTDQTWNTEHVQLVPVLGRHLMHLKGKAVFCADLLKCALGIACIAVGLDGRHRPDFCFNIFLGGNSRGEQGKTQYKLLLHLIIF